MDLKLERKIKWDLRYMALAAHIATWSKDPSTQVGAVLVRSNNSIASTGYNGFAPGADDSRHLYLDKDYKAANVIHAEINAVDFFMEISKLTNLDGFTLYSSFPTCPDCMETLGARRLSRVVQTTLKTEGKDSEWIARWTKNIAKAREVAAFYRITLDTIDV